MAQQNKGPGQNKKTTPPQADKVAKENQREKAERKEVAAHLERNGKRREAALGELAWALLASTEFRMNH